jgi:hypothetical protein
VVQLVTVCSVVLTYLAESRPGLAPVLERAIGLPTDAARFEPATLAIGGLMLIALQTKLILNRGETGSSPSCHGESRWTMSAWSDVGCVRSAVGGACR